MEVILSTRRRNQTSLFFYSKKRYSHWKLYILPFSRGLILMKFEHGVQTATMHAQIKSEVVNDGSSTLLASKPIYLH